MSESKSTPQNFCITLKQPDVYSQVAGMKKALEKKLLVWNEALSPVGSLVINHKPNEIKIGNIFVFCQKDCNIPLTIVFDPTTSNYQVAILTNGKSELAISSQVLPAFIHSLNAFHRVVWQMNTLVFFKPLSRTNKRID